MIVELIIEAVLGLVGFVVGLFPTFDPPAFLTSGISGPVATIVSAASGLGYWVPWDIAAQCIAFVLAAVATAVVIKLVRIIASYLLAGGGSAG